MTSRSRRLPLLQRLCRGTGALGPSRRAMLRRASSLISGLLLCTLFSPQAMAAETLTVSAASSLTQALRAMAPDFEARHPDLKLQFNFGASDALLAQVRRGAPVDVLATADRDSMDRAEQQQLLVPGSRRNFVGNTLVLVVPAEGGLPIKNLHELGQSAVRRVAIGKPESVPAGRYARAALQAAGLWDALQARFIYTLNVRQALDYVARGEVDAGLVYASDAQALPGQPVRVRVVATLPTPEPIRYPVAVLQASPRQAQAARFVAYLQTPAAQALLRAHGFGAP